VSKEDGQSIYLSTATKCNGINENTLFFFLGAFPYVHVVELLVGLLVEPVAAHLPHDLIHPFPALLDLSISSCLGFSQGSKRVEDLELQQSFLVVFSLENWKPLARATKWTREGNEGEGGKAGRAGNLVPSCFRRKQVEIASRFYF